MNISDNNQTVINRPYHKANVIWILCDQLRGDAFSYAGDVNVQTPNIDNLVRQGKLFDSAVSGSPSSDRSS